MEQNDPENEKWPITTLEAAKRLGKSKAHVVTTLSRHPELRPAKEFGQNFMWSEEEFNRLKAHLAGAKRGRPSTKKD